LDETADEMLHWLVGDCRLFGLTMQHWMPVVAGVLVIYIAVLVALNRRDQPHIR
jgi:hypothetical protein